MNTNLQLKILRYPLSAVFIIFLILSISGCSREKRPSGAVIEAAKQRTVAIIDSVAKSRAMVMSQPELIEEYYNDDLQQYVMKYHLKTEFGSTFTDSPVAYIVKEGNRWKYRFQFGGMHESYQTVK